MNKNRSINEVAIANIISTGVSQGAAFLAVFLFSRMLGADQYGRYAVLSSWILLFTSVMGIGTESTIAIAIYQYKDNYLSYKKSLLVYGFFLNLVLGFVIVVCLFPFYKRFELSFKIILFLLFISYANYTFNFFKMCCIYEMKVWLLLKVTLIISLSALGLAYLFVISFSEEYRYWGKLFGDAIPYCIFLIIYLFLGILKSKVNIDFSYFKYALILGGPIVFHSIGHIVLAQSDRIMMKWIGVANSKVGIYSFYYTMAMILAAVLDTLNNSWCPFFYKYLNNQDKVKVNQKSRNYIELFTSIVFVYLLIVREVIAILQTEEYLQGISLLPILVLSVYFTFVYQFSVNYEFYLKKTRIIAIGTVLTAILNIVLNCIFIPIWQDKGAAVATCFSYIFLSALHNIFVRKTSDYKWIIKSKPLIWGITSIIIGIFLFYWFADFAVIRWIFALVIACIEGFRVLKRKSIW